MRYDRYLLATAVFLLNTVTAAAQENYIPRISGLVKAKFETSLYDGESRFSVRNTRLGINGSATPNMYYAIQIELNALGNLVVLDTYAGYHIKGFDLTLGQQSYKFTTELNRGAGNNYFANRSFMGKFISNYVGYENGRKVIYDIGPRDLGAMLQYRGEWRVPVVFNVGVFNGAGLNNPKWNNGMNVVARIDAELPKGFGVSASYYNGKLPTRDRIEMWGAEARYTDRRLIVEAEFARRYQKIAEGTDVMTVAVVHAMYTIPFRPNMFAENITPQLRWDYGDNIHFLNRQTDALESFNAQRITAGICFGLTDRLLRSEIRFNYEHYFTGGDRPSDYGINKMLQDKFTVEFFVKF